MNIFIPEDFDSSSDREHIARLANEKLTQWLKNNSKPVYSWYADHWHENHTIEAHLVNTHKALLVFEELIEPCKHSNDKVRFISDSWICECGAKVKPKGFELNK